MPTSYPQQGQVYLIKALRSLGDTKKHLIFPEIMLAGASTVRLRRELSRTTKSSALTRHTSFSRGHDDRDADP